MRIVLTALALIVPVLCGAADAAPRWAIVIHGGAGVIARNQRTAEQEAAYRESLTRAIGAGSDVLKRGGPALDASGNIAAGTSTGGLTGKRWGRVGDTPIIGAGTYAANDACAVSATGHGEYFIRLAAAH